MSANGDAGSRAERDTARPSVALIVGASGIGAETAPPVLEILESAGARFDFVRVDVPTAVRRNTETVLGEAAEAIRDCRVALKTRLIGPGPDAVRVGPGPQNPNVALRQMLGLWASVRPVRSMPGLPTRYPGLDVLLIREITESVYRGIEHEIVDGVVESMKVVSRDACRRIADYAFRIARRHGRKRITVIHKANIMKQSDGLFLDTVRSVAAGYTDKRHVALFVGVAPLTDPRFLMVVVINDASGSRIGGGALAAPVFARVAERALRLVGVPPDGEQVAVAHVPEGRS